MTGCSRKDEFRATCDSTDGRAVCIVSPSIPMTPESRLAELKLELPPAPQPVAVYKPLVTVERMAYVSARARDQYRRRLSHVTPLLRTSN